MNTKTRSFRPSPALVISCVALFMALAGTAFAAGQVAKNSVRSAQIVDATVRTIDLHDDAVNAQKIAPDAVGSEEIAENAVASPEVAADSLSAADLGTDSVGSNELQAGSVRAAELGTIITASNATTIKGGGNASVSVACPAGTNVISGGANAGFYQVTLASSYRSGNGWTVDAHSGATNDTTLTAQAYCLSGGASN